MHGRSNELSGVARAMNGNAMQRYGIEEQGRSKERPRRAGAMSGEAMQEQRIERKRKAGARIGKAWHGRSRELIRGARAM